MQSLSQLCCAAVVALVCAGTLLAATQPPVATWCGAERRLVKTGVDVAAASVDLNTPVPETIAHLTSLPPPTKPPLATRLQPTETTIYVVNATLIKYKRESDQDYHLVIQDAQGNTMIAEIPNPTCVGASSTFTVGIHNARAQFDAVYTAGPKIVKVSVPVRITGVGFFDFKHGQTGVAPNAIELHPVLDIVFNPPQ